MIRVGASRRAAALLIALAAALSCASPPRRAPLGPVAADEGGPAASSAGAAEIREPSAEAMDELYEGRRRRPLQSIPDQSTRDSALGEYAIGYLEGSLARYRRVEAPNGAVAAALRLDGRKRAVLRLSVRCGRSYSGYMEAAAAALVLEASARGPALAPALKEAGAAIGLGFGGPGEVALSAACPASSVQALARALVAALASPSLDRESFELARRRLLLSELRKEGDPASRAGAEFLIAEAGGQAAGAPAPSGSPAKDAASLLNRITPAEASSSWAASVGADRVSLTAVGEVEPSSTAEDLAAMLAEWPSRARPAAGKAGAPAAAGAGEADAPAGAPKAVPLTSMPGSSMLVSAFSAPRAGEAAPADYGPTLVALSMLRDLLEADPPPAIGRAFSVGILAPEGPRSPAILTVGGIADPAGAKSAVEKAISVLASGKCASESTSEAPQDIPSRLGYYKAKALTAFYSSSSSELIAARVALSIADGGDGTDFFRAAARIAQTRPDDVARVARGMLTRGGSAWVALGDPEVLRGMGGRATASASP